jgi:hypothetical protein
LATTIIGTLNSIATKYELPEIEDFSENNNIRVGIDEIIKNNPNAKLLANWTGLKRRLETYFSSANVTVLARDLDTAIETLKNSGEHVTHLVLANLYETAIDSLNKLGYTSVCPICDQGFKGDLVSHLRLKHSLLEALNKAKRDFELKRDELGITLKTIFEKSKNLLDESDSALKKELQTFFDLVNSVSSLIPEILADLRKPAGSDIKADFVGRMALAKVDEIRTFKERVSEKVDEKIAALSNDKKITDLARDYETVGSLTSTYIEYTKCKGKLAYLTSIFNDYNKLDKELTNFIQSQIEHIFSEIQENVMDYFHILEGNNTQFRNPRIKLVDGRNKAVELEIEFVDEAVTPAFKFMSESQINSFGLSIFLAAVRHFNKDFRFMILDDVINSFDDYKRPKVPQLLQSKFDDFQIFLLTHDQIFFETVQRAFPSWKRYRFTYWDYLIGPKIQLAKSYLEEVEEELKNDNPISAGQKLGRYLEWIFGTLNQKLRTPIEFRLESAYTLSELYEPFLKRLRDKLKRVNHTHRLVSFFDDLDQGTIFRNYCAHWKNEAVPFSTPEIRTIHSKWLEIEKLLFCDQCKSFIQLEKKDGVEYVRCNCNDLNLKEDEYYLPSA